MREELKRVLGLDLPVDDWAKEEGIADEEIFTRVERRADEHMAAKVAQWGPDVIRYVEKSILLQTLDHLWREHLVMLDHLRQVIGLRGYGQRDPLNEYKAESFSLFEAMSQSLREAVTAQLMRVEIQAAPAAAAGGAARHGGAQVRSDDRRGRDGAGYGRRRNAGAPRHRTGCRFRQLVRAPSRALARPGAQSAGSAKLGQSRPQRAVSLRLRQKIQALSRTIRLTGRRADAGHQIAKPL